MTKSSYCPFTVAVQQSDRDLWIEVQQADERLRCTRNEGVRGLYRGWFAHPPGLWALRILSGEKRGPGIVVDRDLREVRVYLRGGDRSMDEMRVVWKAQEPGEAVVFYDAIMAALQKLLALEKKKVDEEGEGTGRIIVVGGK